MTLKTSLKLNETSNQATRLVKVPLLKPNYYIYFHSQQRHIYPILREKLYQGRALTISLLSNSNIVQ